MSHPKREDPRDIEAIHTLRAVLPTRRRAQLLFDTLAVNFAAEIVIVAAEHGAHRRMFRRDGEHPEVFVPWPWVRFEVKTPSSERGAESPASTRDRGLGPGKLDISDGASSLEFTYDDSGSLHETSRSGPSALWIELARSVREAQGNGFEALIDAVSRVSPARGGQGRLIAPQPSPHAIEFAFGIALAAVRDACFEREFASENLWIAADGFAGSVVVAHPDRSHALQLCREEIARVEPRPASAKPTPMPTPDELAALGYDDDLIVLRGPRHDDAERIKPTIANTPIFVAPLDALPQRQSPLGTWERLLDSRGTCTIVAARRDRRGTLVASQRALARIDASRIDAVVGIADAREREVDAFAMHRPWPASLPPLRSRMWIYEIERQRSGEAIARICSASRTPGFRYAQITPEALGEGILRQTWER